MPTLDEQIADLEQQLADLKRQKADNRGFWNRYQVIDRATGAKVPKTFVLQLEKAFDRAVLLHIADELDRRGIKPQLASDIRDQVDKIENPPAEPEM